MSARNIRLWNEEEFEEVLDDFKKKGDKALLEDPFFNPELRKTKGEQKAKKSKKKFEGYNWTTHKKKIKGMKAKIKEMNQKPQLTEKEKLILKRMKSLLAWHEWSLSKHNEGWSDKRIHEETIRRKQKK